MPDEARAVDVSGQVLRRGSERDDRGRAEPADRGGQRGLAAARPWLRRAFTAGDQGRSISQ